MADADIVRAIRRLHRRVAGMLLACAAIAFLGLLVAALSTQMGTSGARGAYGRAYDAVVRWPVPDEGPWVIGLAGFGITLAVVSVTERARGATADSPVDQVRSALFDTATGIASAACATGLFMLLFFDLAHHEWAVAAAAGAAATLVGCLVGLYLPDELASTTYAAVSRHDARKRAARKAARP